jgi:chromosome segregation protein
MVGKSAGGRLLVFIRRVEMRGFKSFGIRKVTVPLEKGLTVVTGPNGSGKSNIFDAVRFVLGDLSARSLRADKMSEVIYDVGEDSSRAAYVTIQFDNTDRRIPVDAETATFSRRVNVQGTSEYFLNGRQVPRGQLVDMMSLAGLSSNGHNMIMQGTITRLADIIPEDRRKFIEELVGIAEYDTKKAEARVQLQQADMNLKIASARIGDVQARLERLEEERNDALRYNFVQSELRRFQAALTSYRFFTLSDEKSKLDEAFCAETKDVESLRREREKLQVERDGIELERRRFDQEVADKGSARLVEVQRAMGDILSQSAACRMEIDSGRTSLTGLLRIRRERLEQFQGIEKRLQETKELLPKLRKERDEIKAFLEEKNSIYKDVSTRLVEMKESLGTSTSKIGELEEEIGKLNRLILKLDSDIKANSTRHRLVSENLGSLKERSLTFGQTSTDLQKHFDELKKIYAEEQEGVTHLSESLGKKVQRKTGLSTEVESGEATIRLAREAVVEFEAQREVAERFLAEEASLQRIEEMLDSGALLGVYARLEQLVSIEPRYRRALSVASAGWMQALVVEDAEIALRCVEILKKMRLSPLKLIPLKEISEAEPVEPPDIEGIVGPATSLIKTEEKYLPAVNFVFGDTLVASGEKSAFLSSKAGYRTVDLDGDLYEARGAIIAGFYRAPLELSSLVPSRRTVEGLSSSVVSLEKIVIRRRQDITTLEGDMNELAEDRARRTQLLVSLENDLKTVEVNIARVKENTSALTRRNQSLTRYLERGAQIQEQLLKEKEEHRKHLIELIQKRRSLRAQIKPDVLGKLESDKSQLNTEVSDYDRRLTKIQSEVASLETSLETKLRPDFEAVQTDLRTLDRQITSLEEKVGQAQKALGELNGQLDELAKAKDALSASLSSVRDRRREFEDALDRIDNQLRKVDREYEPISEKTHRLELKVQDAESEIRHLLDELRGLGYETPLQTTPDVVRQVEASMNLARFELERLGSVNQLAVAQYNEQQENFKQLSVRRNQLEAERKAIVDFMEEIERKKKDAFMQAFNGIDQHFVRLFTKLTRGGNARLSLQNPEDPFAGGIDIFVQFPGKGSRLVAGASGGEKSLTAVAFILAIQSLSPAPFYIFDEIDAHLDPAYTEMLADLLKEQATYSQFVVISLRDVVMERADRLLGVYIQDGTSRIVTTRIAEAVA